MKDYIIDFFLNDGFSKINFNQVKICLLGMGILVLVLFVLRGFGIYSLAKNQNLKNSGLAFLPITNNHTFGLIAQKYPKKDGKESANFSAILVLLSVGVVVSSLFLTGFTATSLLEILVNAETAFAENKDMTVSMFSSLIPVIVFFVILVALLLAKKVVYLVALWRVYAIFVPKYAVLFIILSVLFGFADNILLFAIKNKKIIDE